MHSPQRISRFAAGHTPTLGLAAVIAIIVAGFLVGATLATRFPVLRLPFIPPGEMRHEVERRALEVFQRYRIRTTRGGTGVLIYVSLYEHMVRVVPGASAAIAVDFPGLPGWVPAGRFTVAERGSIETARDPAA